MSGEITLFTKSAGALSKRISIDANGKIVSDGSECRMSAGVAKRMPNMSAENLAKTISNIPSDSAIAIGALIHDAGAEPNVVAARKLKDAADGTIARTTQFLEFRKGAPGWMLLDFDRKGMPAEIASRIDAAGGIFNLISDLFPALLSCPVVRRPSTSSGLYHAETGQQFAASGGEHIFINVADAGDIPRALGRFSPAGVSEPVEPNITLCQDARNLVVSIPAPERLTTVVASSVPRSRLYRSVSEDVFQFPNAAAASSAFADLGRAASSCTGTPSGSSTIASRGR